jgi:hypothetical protein
MSRSLSGAAGAFEFPDAELTPVGGGHFAYEEVFDGGFGPEGFVELRDEGVESGAGLACEHDGSGEEPVAEGVARGAGFALGSFGSAGACSVGEGCGFLFFGCHRCD